MRLKTGAFYNYSDPGDVTIQVHVWGATRFPGLYEIPVLADGNVLTFEATIRQGFRFRDIFPIVSMVGTIVLILDRAN